MLHHTPEELERRIEIYQIAILILFLLSVGAYSEFYKGFWKYVPIFIIAIPLLPALIEYVISLFKKQETLSDWRRKRFLKTKKERQQELVIGALREVKEEEETKQ